MSLRRSFRMEWMKNKQGEVMGINLGADYCAEHEWGIDRLKEVLGIQDTNPSGIESRKITLLPEENLFVLDEVKKKKTGKTILMVEGQWTIRAVKESIKNMNKEIMPYAPRGTQPEVATAWGKDAFSIICSKEEDRANLRTLITALKAGDVALWLGGGGVFQNNGLILVIVSKVDDENKQQMKDNDENNLRLKEADTATGIREALKESSKSFFALSPAWSTTIRSTSRGELTTNHSVIYFLNPCEQHKYNHGWFTVEELQQWANNQGPIIKAS